MKVFAVYDSKAEIYQTPPVFAETTGIVIRSLTDALSNPNHDFAKYTSDFTLFEIGTYDPKSGLIEPLTPIKPVGNFSEFKPVA